MDHQGKAVLAVGRHRADSEDRQRHDDGPRHPAPKPVAEDLGKGGTARAGAGEDGTVATIAGVSTRGDDAAAPANGAAALRPRRDSSRSTQAAAARPASPTTVRRNHDLLDWGLFLAVTASASMVWAGIDWTITAVCGFLLLLSFAAVWYVSSTPPAAPVEHAPAKDPVKDASPVKEPVPVKAAVPEREVARAKKEAAPAKAPAPLPSAATQVSSETPAAEAPLTRKQMRAADPTTGVMPVVSVFARKPAAGAPAARTSASPTEPPVPSAPAGQLLQGIDTGAPAPDSRRARRAAAAAAAGAKKKSSGQAAPAAKPDPAPKAEPVSKAPAKVKPAPTVDPAGAKAETADSAATAENSDGESRWTRVFGPPETGQLPVQRYVPAATAVEPADGSMERQQRSHSSL